MSTNSCNLCDISLSHSIPRSQKTGNFTLYGELLLRIATRSGSISLPILPLTPQGTQKSRNDSSASLFSSSNLPRQSNMRSLSRQGSVAILNNLSQSRPSSQAFQAKPLKRPGDYFNTKPSSFCISDTVTDNSRFSGIGPKFRACLNGSIFSNSDDQSLLVSLQFDRNEFGTNSWRNSSAATSVYLPSPKFLEPKLGIHYSVVNERASTIARDEGCLPRNVRDQDPFCRNFTGETESYNWSRPHENRSDSTIVSPSAVRNTLKSLVSSAPVSGSKVIPDVRVALDSSIYPENHLNRSSSVSLRPMQSTSKLYDPFSKYGSSMGLSRTRSAQFSIKEAKERLQMRKKRYDDFCDDDDILPAEAENLVFNVPVIKNPLTLYRLNLKRRVNADELLSASMSAREQSVVSREDLIMLCKDTKYAGAHNAMATLQLECLPLSDDQMDHLDDLRGKSGVFFRTDDAEITRNISSISNQQSQSIFDATKRERSDEASKSVPGYIRSQSSIEDFQLISAEKVKCLDQTRPIHLPPKSATDKSKHKSYISLSLSAYHVYTLSQIESMRKLAEQGVITQRLGTFLIESLMSETNFKLFNKMFHSNRLALRNLAWRSAIPSNLLYTFLVKTLSSNINNSDYLLTIAKDYAIYEDQYAALSSAIKSSKEIEFSRIIFNVMDRPLINCMVLSVQEMHPSFSSTKFTTDYMFLMYIKSLSETGLHKHEETFTIPILMLLFYPTLLLCEIFCLVELFTLQVFEAEFLSTLNICLDTWSCSWKSTPGLHDFDTSEFKGLNSSVLFEILLQLNDSLPLCHSASCTTIQGLLFASSTDLLEERPSLKLQPSSLELLVFALPDSAATGLVTRILLLLAIHSNALKTRSRNYTRVLESLLQTIFRYYHLNWNSFGDLLRDNKSIRLNKLPNQSLNLTSFTDKWWDGFRKL